MFEFYDAVFARAIAKALLIVVVSFGIVVYLAWAGTWRREKAAILEIALKRLLLKHRHITR